MTVTTFYDGFTITWASAGSTANLDSADLQTGWAYIGSTPPTVEQFNTVHQQGFQRDQWLWGQVKGVTDYASLTLSASSTTTLRDAIALMIAGAGVSVGTLTAGSGLTGGGSMASNQTVSMGTPSSITSSTSNSASGTTHTHALDSTGVAIGTYGSASNTAGTAPSIGYFTVDVKGRITSAGNTTLGTAASYAIGTSGATVPLLSGANTWSGIQTFAANVTVTGWRLSVDSVLSTIAASANNPAKGIVVNSGASSGSTDASYINFIRQGNYGLNFGLDSDNKMKVGGGSMGAVSYEIWHAGNQLSLGTTQASGRTALGLGNVVTYAVGTSGSTVPLLSSACTWSNTITVSSSSADHFKSVRGSYTFMFSNGGDGTYYLFDSTNNSRGWSYSTSTKATTFGGTVYATGFQVSSSRELKEKFRANHYGLDAVMALETTIGRYRAWFNEDQRERVFLIAESVAEAVPLAVDADGIEATPEGSAEPQKFASYSADQLLPVLVKAIQDLYGIVQEQQEQITTLQERIV